MISRLSRYNWNYINNHQILFRVAIYRFRSFRQHGLSAVSTFHVSIVREMFINNIFVALICVNHKVIAMTLTETYMWPSSPKIMYATKELSDQRRELSNLFQHFVDQSSSKVVYILWTNCWVLNAIRTTINHITTGLTFRYQPGNQESKWCK